MKKKILFSLICLIMSLVITKVSYASVEIIPSKNGKGTDSIVNTTISNSYLLCQNMKNEGETLYGSTVLPHLATNKDWGAISYLSNSIYGTNTTGGENGIEVTIDGVKYYSTTTNITGVMNWGSNPNGVRVTQTAGLIYTYDNSTVNSNITEIYNNKDSRFVNIIESETMGMAFRETSALSKQFYFGTGKTYPISIRTSLFGLVLANDSSGRYNYASGATGEANYYSTFRPVIWNK